MAITSRPLLAVDGDSFAHRLPDQAPTWTTAADLARALELNRLAECLAALAQSA